MLDIIIAMGVAAFFSYLVPVVTDKVVTFKNKNNKYIDRPYSESFYRIAFLLVGFFVTYSIIMKMEPL